MTRLYRVAAAAVCLAALSGVVIVAQATNTAGAKMAAAVELAVLLHFLAFIFIIAVDWARIFYYSQTVTNCARNGAIYCSDPLAQAGSPYASVTQAALADASDMSPAPTVTSASGNAENQ